jgi:cytochrome c oxidase cbb3-type subunit IV
MGIARGLITLILMVAFLALVAWLASSRNKHRFDAAARMPLEDDANSVSSPIPSPHAGEG